MPSNTLVNICNSKPLFFNVMWCLLATDQCVTSETSSCKTVILKCHHPAKLIVTTETIWYDEIKVSLTPLN